MARRRKTDPCHCGSGKQFRYCHGIPEDSEDAGPKVARNPRQIFLWVIVVGAPLAYAASFLQPDPEQAANRVWSEEHGHWHDATTNEPEPVAAATEATTAEAGAPAGGENAPPPGEAPPGKVWDPVHGHWHDAEASQRAAGDGHASDGPWESDYKIQRPDGPAPEGQVWSDAHGHWHPSDGG